MASMQPVASFQAYLVHSTLPNPAPSSTKILLLNALLRHFLPRSASDDHTKPTITQTRALRPGPRTPPPRSSPPPEPAPSWRNPCCGACRSRGPLWRLQTAAGVSEVASSRPPRSWARSISVLSALASFENFFFLFFLSLLLLLFFSLPFAADSPPPFSSRAKGDLPGSEKEEDEGRKRHLQKYHKGNY